MMMTMVMVLTATRMMAMVTMMQTTSIHEILMTLLILV